MRFVGMLSMTALILTGLPPAPIGLATADAQGRRMGYVQPRGGEVAIYAPVGPGVRKL